MQDEGREQDGGDGVKIAQDRERLRREIGHRAKIEAVGEAGVDDAKDQQQGELSARDLEADEVAVQDAVGDEDKRRDEQLHERAVVGGDVAELLVAEDDAAVEHGRQQAEQDAARRAAHRGDEHGVV